jgi:hypothetical protein
MQFPFSRRAEEATDQRSGVDPIEIERGIQFGWFSQVSQVSEFGVGPGIGRRSRDERPAFGLVYES